MPKKFKPVVNETTVYVQGRLSYAHLLEPHAAVGSDEKFYSCVILIDKSDTDSIEAIKKATDAAVKKGIGTKWQGKEPRKLSLPLHDGEEKEGEEFHGKVYLNAKSKSAPAVLDRKKAPILKPDGVYSGMWAIVCLNLYPYSSTGNNGVGAGLNAILKTADDEAFSGAANGARAFDNIEISDEDDDDEDII